MHKLSVGIAFDHVFFQQLAGRNTSLKDMQEVDPNFYQSCKQILEMEPKIVNGLKLSFVREIRGLALMAGIYMLIVRIVLRAERYNLC